ncbi:hypothetical protein LMH73_024740 [Vibrio splendidus]|nr:hypothetical protein [Vibrio splendidus]MCC4880389.1 hypothetical protein [Vibrio splendidus]
MKTDEKQPFYTVKQFNSEKKVISRTETMSPVLAICDFAIKTKLHISKYDEISISSQQMISDIKHADEIKMVSVATNNETKSIVGIVVIESSLFDVGADVENTISSDTVKRFRSPSYLMALQGVCSTMIKLSGGNTEIMKIIAVIASKDPSHTLWNPKKPSAKNLSLG